MIDLLDAHTHTVASGHAYNTMNEMLLAAKEKGLQLLAVTDHGNGMEGTTPRYYFENSTMIDREAFCKRFGVKLLFGVELNLMDFDGRVDMSQSLLEKMDLAIVSIHPPCFPKGATKEQVMEAYCKAMRNPLIQFVGHPDDGRFPVDYRMLVQAAKEYHVALEVNNHSLDGKGGRTNARQNDMEMLRFCMEYEVPVILNSDAHVDTEVGNHKDAWALIREIGFPEKLILNTDLELFKTYVNHYYWD
ncbi:MAG: phosphatase [Fusicatenibacter sp.]|nr:phosphatase [Lachnospiraceae bacterium]MDY2937415.1 phosphatase [Fusicatenibacter sp.]